MTKVFMCSYSSGCLYGPLNEVTIWMLQFTCLGANMYRNRNGYITVTCASKPGYNVGPYGKHALLPSSLLSPVACSA